MKRFLVSPLATALSVLVAVVFILVSAHAVRESGHSRRHMVEGRAVISEIGALRRDIAKIQMELLSAAQQGAPFDRVRIGALRDGFSRRALKTAQAPILEPAQAAILSRAAASVRGLGDTAELPAPGAVFSELAEGTRASALLSELEAELRAGLADDSRRLDGLMLVLDGLVFVACVLWLLQLGLFHQFRAQIVRRREAERALRESERRLDSIVSALDDVVWSGSAKESKTLYMSPSAARLYGHPPEEFFTNTNLWIDVVHPEDRDLVRGFTQTLFEQETRAIQYRIVRPDGQVRWVSDRGRLTRDAQGRPDRLDGIVSDITDRKLAEDRLREAREFAQSIIDCSLDMIVAVDEQRRITVFNEAAQKTLGYTLDEVMGRHVSMLYADQGESNGVDAMLDRVDAYVVEVTNRRKNGNPFPALVSASVMRDASGNVRGYMGVSRDISIQKRQEAELRKAKDLMEKRSAELAAANSALAKNERRLAALFEHSPSGILVEAPDGTIRDVSPSFCRMLGFTSGELLGMKIARLSAAPEDAVREHIARIIAGEDLEHTVLSVRKDGARRHMQLNETRVPLEDGSEGVLAIVTDVTERIEAEERVRRYALVYESMRDGVAAFTAEGRIAFSNPAMARMSGRPAETMAGLHVDELWGRSLLAELEEPTSDSYQSMVRPDGSAVAVSVNSFVLEENPPLRVAIFRDVTRQRDAERARRESELKLRYIIDNARDSIYMKDAAGTYRMMNKAGAALFGMRPEDVIGRTDSDLFGDDAEDVMAIDRELMDRREHRRYEATRLFAGVPRTLSTSKFPFIGHDGRLLGLIGMSHDITDRKRAEEALREATALQRAILDSATVAIIAADTDGVVTLFNPEAERMLGYSAQEVVGRQSPGVFHLREEIEARAAELSEELGEPVPPGFRVFVAAAERGASEARNWTYVRKDGGRLTVLLTVSAIRDGEGALTGYLGIATDITEQQRARDAVRESEQRFRQLALAIREVFFIAAPDFTSVQYVSPALREIWGRAPEDAMATPSLILDAVVPDDRVTFLRAVRACARLSRDAGGGDSVNVEYRILRPDGATRWIRSRTFPIFGGQGTATHIAGISEDITERRAAQEALRASEEKYRNIVDNTAEGIGAIRSDGRFSYANRAAEAIFGTDPGALHGASIEAFLDEGDTGYVGRQLRSCLDGSKVQFEMQVRRGDGGTRDLRVTAAPLRDDTGGIVGALALLSDVTELVRARLTLIRELSFLSEVEALGRAVNGQTDLRAIMEQIVGAIVTHCEVDDALALYGRDEQGRLTRRASTRPGDSEDGDVWDHFGDGAVQRVIESRGEVAVEDVEGDPDIAGSNLVRACGARSIVGLPIQAGDELLGIVFGLRRQAGPFDQELRARLQHLSVLAGSALGNALLIARLHDNAVELGRIVAQLRAEERVREQFYRFLVHDLNKPLAAIIGTASRVEAATDMPEELRPRVARISSAAIRLRDIVAQLLEYERIRRGDLTFDLSEFDLLETARDLVALLHERHPRHRMLLQGMPAEETAGLPPMRLRSDPVQAGRVLQNVIDNALKYGAGHVEIRIEEAGPVLRVRVWNDGKPIPPEDRERIFQEFFQRATAEGRQGFGLGLTAVKRLLEALGGRISVDSPERGGTEFTLEFPRTGATNP